MMHGDFDELGEIGVFLRAEPRMQTICDALEQAMEDAAHLGPVEYLAFSEPENATAVTDTEFDQWFKKWEATILTALLEIKNETDSW